MRRSFWLWRTSVTVWLTPVIAVAAAVTALSNAAFVMPYWQDVSAKATVGVVVICPAYAAAAAWDGGRFRRLRTNASRAALAPALLSVLPAVIGSAATLTVTLLLIARDALPAAGLPDWRLLGLAVLLTTVFAAVGYAIGVRVPRVFGPPMAFGLVWVWLVLPPTVQPFWIRNVTGNLGTSCCSMDITLPARAVLAPAVVAVAVLVVAALIVALPWRRTVTTVVSVVLLGSGVLVGWSLIRDDGADPVVARTAGLQCRTEGDYRVCAWNEDRDLIATAAPGLVATAERLRVLDPAAPWVLTERTDESTEWSFSLRGTGQGQWNASLAVSRLAGVPPACLERTGGVWAAVDALDPAQALLLLTAGVDEEDVTGQFGPLAVDVARQLLARPPQQQAAWFDQTRAALATCDQPPIPVPTA